MPHRVRDTVGPSALAGLETALHLVDHIDPALAADEAVVAVATAQRFQRVTDLHGISWNASERPCSAGRKTINRGSVPAGGPAAGDARVLGHGASGCQSEPGYSSLIGGRKRLIHRESAGFRPVTRKTDPAETRPWPPRSRPSHHPDCGPVRRSGPS